MSKNNNLETDGRNVLFEHWKITHISTDFIFSHRFDVEEFAIGSAKGCEYNRKFGTNIVPAFDINPILDQSNFDAHMDRWEELIDQYPEKTNNADKR